MSDEARIVPWRPRNETPTDLARELATAQVIEDLWQVKVVKLSERLYEIDWAFFRGDDLKAWAEFKYREKRYDTLLLSSAKWMRGRWLARESGVPFLIFIHWPDGLYWYQCGDGVLPIQKGGNSRGQNGDIEPCVLIDTSTFKKMPCG